MQKCVNELLLLEKHWFPKKENHSMYIRPNSICMDNKIGLGRVTKMKTFVVLCPVGSYYPKPCSLYCDTDSVRSWPQGFGDKKLGSNYAPTLKAQYNSGQLYGCDSVLWLLHDYITEAGTMNFFIFWKNENGENELITPPLDGTILPGVTRDTILTIAKEMNEFKVTIG